MDKIQTCGVTDQVADTLFIPLYMRCLETRREDKILEDLEACRVVESVDYDFSKYDGGWRSQVGTCIRARHFDRVARGFILANDDPVVVNLGCGLDARAARVGLDKGVFYNVDLPEVMVLRDQLMPPDERNISIHKSMFESGWPQLVRDTHPDSPVLVIAEGVFVYFTNEEVRRVIRMIAQALAPGELLFDGSTSLACRMSRRHDTVKYTDARFKLALDDDLTPEQWAPNLRLQDVVYYMDKEKHRWDLMAKVMSVIPFFNRMFRMLHYQMEAVETELAA